MRKICSQIFLLTFFVLFFPLSTLADGNVQGIVQGSVENQITLHGGSGEIPPNRTNQAVATLPEIPAPATPIKLKDTLWIEDDVRRFFNLKSFWSVEELDYALEEEIKKRLNEEERK